MRKEVLWGKRNLRFYYYRYKDSPYYSLAIFIIVIVVCFVLLFNVVVPQVSNLFSIRKEVEATREKIAVLRNNINLMNNMDKAVLDSQFQVASSALPPEKDFAAVLNALSDAAIRSGVTFDDFNFQVGTLESSDMPTIRISLVVHGSLSGLKNFLHETETKIPISEVTSINGSGQAISINIQFYQKPFAKGVLKNDEPIVGLSDKKRELLQKLSSWTPQVAPVESLSSNATSGAVPLF